jgi:mRNA-degrading endonuclease toxin of MazEF toxin-antitoxin module
MKRSELYRVAYPSAQDPKKYRVFVVVSLSKTMLTHFVGTLLPVKIRGLNQALRVALDLAE